MKKNIISWIRILNLKNQSSGRVPDTMITEEVLLYRKYRISKRVGMCKAKKWICEYL